MEQYAVHNNAEHVIGDENDENPSEIIDPHGDPDDVEDVDFQHHGQVNVSRHKREKKKKRDICEKIKKQVEKHKILAPCCCKAKQCYEKFDENTRTGIHDGYWKQDYNGRKLWLTTHLKFSEPKRQYTNREDKDENDELSRHVSTQEFIFYPYLLLVKADALRYLSAK